VAEQQDDGGQNGESAHGLIGEEGDEPSYRVRQGRARREGGKAGGWEDGRPGTVIPRSECDEGSLEVRTLRDPSLRSG